jgi:hypothetical protein
MHPGRARLVNTPASSSESDLLREVARTLGLQISAQQRGYQLREQITAVLQASQLMLVFDEAQFLFPSAFSRNTAPARLNWVRRSVMDEKLGAAFVCTPQSYGQARRRYVKATGYAIEQFDERILKTVELPAEVSREDLLAIAQVHFPGVHHAYLDYVVSKAVATERNYVSDVSKVAKLAHDNASESGRAVPNLDDIKAALADVLPRAPTAPRDRETPLLAAVADPVQPSCSRIAQPLATPRTRQVSPIETSLTT